MFTHYYALKVTTRRAGTFLVNITGAQFGWYKPVIPWWDFEQAQLDKILVNEPLGAEFRERTESMSAFRRPHSDAEARVGTPFEYLVGGPSQEWDELYRGIYYMLYYTVKEQLVKMETSAVALLKMPEGQFQESSKALLEGIEKEFDKHVSSLEGSKSWYLEWKDGKSDLCRAGGLSETAPEHFDHAIEDLRGAGLFVDLTQL